MRPHPLTALLVLAGLCGFAFAAASTYDFAAHLDRQVHGIHCSFLPGLTAAETGETGCHVTLMSPYSSIARGSIWGGIPIALPAMSVFAFLVFWGLWLALRARELDPRAALFTLAATALPAATSLVMGYISLAQLGAACKLCIGIYLSSTTAFVAAVLMWLRARKQISAAEPVAWGVLGLCFALGITFVLVPVTTYAMSAPDFSRYAGRCGELANADAGAALIALGPQNRTASMLEVLDPLCPSCRGFEQRYARMDAELGMNRHALLFPLDNACNWMIRDAIHPGACSISEAMFCAGDHAEQVLAWSFANQDAIIEATKKDPKAAASMVSAQFPEVARCVGTSAARAKLNLALRFAVKNRLQVLTPQVFVEGVRLCDEDTDLGLDFALPRLLEYARSHSKTSPAHP